MFLGADDLLLKNSLLTYLEFRRERNSIAYDYVCAKNEYISLDNEFLKVIRLPPFFVHSIIFFEFISDKPLELGIIIDEYFDKSDLEIDLTSSFVTIMLYLVSKRCHISPAS
jgi:hypothetical protein